MEPRWENYNWLDDGELQERLEEAVKIHGDARDAWGGMNEHRIFDVIIAAYNDVIEYQEATIERLQYRLTEANAALTAVREKDELLANATPTADCCAEAKADADEDMPLLLKKLIVGAILSKALADREESPFGRRAQRPTSFGEMFGLS